MTVRVPLAVGLGAVAVFAAAFVFRTSLLQAVGDFLVIQDRLSPADAVIAISGDGTNERVTVAASVVQAGYAPWLVLSGSTGGHARGGATEAMVRAAVRAGIPRERILIDDTSESTQDNARNTLRIMQERGWRRAILITSAYHTRRAARIFRAAFRPQGVEIKVFAARNSFFNADKWWARRRDRNIVLREYGKLFADLIGIH